MKYKLFLSHAHADSKLVEVFVSLLFDIGLREEDIFCSSIAKLGVPIQTNIYDYLRQILGTDGVIPLFFLSDYYYESPACLNEMGAIWMKQLDYFTILMPGFEFKEIKGAINPNKIAIRLEDDPRTLKVQLYQLKEALAQYFPIRISEPHWEDCCDMFLERIASASCNTFEIDLENHRSFCIGYENFGACEMKYIKAQKKVEIHIDFSKTEAALCAAVFFTGGKDVHLYRKQKKKLSVWVRATGDIKKLQIEPHLKNQNIPVEFIVSGEWEKYEFALEDFKCQEQEWECLREISFVAGRIYGQEGTIEIKQLRIE